MNSASLVVSLTALLFAVGSAWWLYGYRGRLSSDEPPRYALMHNGIVFFLRMPLAITNRGGSTLVVNDLRCSFPNRRQAIPMHWRRTVHSLLPSDAEYRVPPLPFAIRGHDAEAILIEFGGPFPGFEFMKGKNEVRIDVLVSGRGWRNMLNFDIDIEDPTKLPEYMIYENPKPDPYQQQLIDKALHRLLMRIKQMREKDDGP